MSPQFFFMSCAATIIVMIVTLTNIARWLNSEYESYYRAIVAMILTSIFIYFVSRSVHALNNTWIYAFLILLIPYIIVITLKTDLRRGLLAAIVTVIAGFICIVISATICSSRTDTSIHDCLIEFKNQLETGLQSLPSKDEMNKVMSTQILQQSTSVTTPQNVTDNATTTQTEAPVPETLIQNAPIQMTPQPAVVKQYQTIDLSQANQYIGSIVRITVNSDGTTRTGQLIAADGNSLTIETRYDSGSVQSKVSVNTIQKLEVKQ